VTSQRNCEKTAVKVVTSADIRIGEGEGEGGGGGEWEGEGVGEGKGEGRGRLEYKSSFYLFFVIKLTRCTNFTNLFWHEILRVSDSSSVPHQEFIHCTLGNGICQTGL
jgi:hypothetical protein